MRPLPLLSCVFVFSACSALKHESLSIPYEKHVLSNGLEVVIHEDHSDPVVAVYVQYHVGSAREEPGRSGFAHLFEHMLFQGSEHVGDDQHFKLVQEAGGTLNGSTTRDRTNYFEVLPSNQLELALWLEADRMGWLLPGMTQEKLDLQRDVVKNERRQNYENRPYGMGGAWVSAALYPAEHPYHWLTIGSQEDLNAASLDDVKSFFSRWYGPNNATLAIGGDIDPKAALALVEKYFGSIPRGPEVAKPAPQPVQIAADQRICAEDRVKNPELTLTWTGVPRNHDDDAALDILARVLTANDTSLLTRALTIDEQLCANVSAQNDSGELAGEFSISMRANPGVTLDALEAKLNGLLAKLASKGFERAALEQVQGRYESDLLRRQESVGPRTSMLANLNCFDKDPGAWKQDLERHQAVEPADLKAVLQRYVVGKHAIALSIVPKGKLELAAKGSSPAPKIGSTAIAGRAPKGEQIAVRNAAADTFDRAQKPGAGPTPPFRAPTVWHDVWPNAVNVTASPYHEVPLALLTLAVPAGQVYENAKDAGIATLTAELLTQGTAKRTALEFRAELERMGANLRAGAGDEELVLTLNVPDKHLAEAAELLAEVVLEPRFATEDFERLQKERLVAIDSRADQIGTIAANAWRKLLHGDSALGLPSAGTHESVAALTPAAVKDFWKAHAAPVNARITYVGSRSDGELRGVLTRLVNGWTSPLKVVQPANERRPQVDRTRIYLIDKPGAAQSEIRIGQLCDTALSPRWYALQVLNQPLGGNFSSRINMNLREDKGYTYGARSAFDGGRSWGQFVASAGVQTEMTKKDGAQVPVSRESVNEFMKEIRGILAGPTEKELAFTKDSLQQGALRQYESMMAINGYLENISRYGYPDDYAAKRLQQLAGMTCESLRDLAQKVLQPDQMLILVVGDKSKVKSTLGDLGFGDPIELDIDGNPLPTTGAQGTR
jgi:zinc protease